MLHREASSAVAIYCFGPSKTQFISGLIDRTVIDITQLGCPQPANISLPPISCTFACHNKCKYVFEFGTACSLPQWLNFYTIILQYAKCHTQSAYHYSFPDVVVTCTYLILQRVRKEVRLNLLE